MIQFTATSYVVFITLVIVFQCCLIAGAPWGRITQGGQYSGKLPLSRRIVALLSIILLLFMAGGITSAAGRYPSWSGWTGWAALAVQFLSTVLNWITPSPLERRLWGPVTSVMLLLASYVIVLG